jgi:hypothetical protein
MALLCLSGYSGPVLLSKTEMEAGAERSLTLHQGRMGSSPAIARGAFLPFFFAVALSAIVANFIRLLALFGQLAR